MAHGCTGKGNDQVRFELDLPGAGAGVENYCAVARVGPEVARRLPRLRREAWHRVAASRDKIHSRDRNLWHISHEGGELEDAGNAPLATTWQITRLPKMRLIRKSRSRSASRREFRFR